MQTVYVYQPFPYTFHKSLYLAGPTPRDTAAFSWRPQALQLLESFAYDGVVFIPESQDRKRRGDYDQQMEWELEAMRRSDMILFWVPAEQDILPAYTTRVEFGLQVHSDKVTLGAPRNAYKAIPSFGGAAREVWENVHAYYRACGVSSEEMSALREAWVAPAAEVAIGVAEQLVRRNPYRSPLLPQLGMLLSLISLLTLWVTLFIKAFTIANTLAFFLLLGISAFLGTGLRTTLRLLSDDVADFSGHRLLTEATAGLVMAFSFALFYCAGGMLLTGDVKHLTLPGDTDFIRVALSMSLLGLAAAFLLERAAESLGQRLREVLASHKPN